MTLGTRRFRIPAFCGLELVMALEPGRIRYSCARGQWATGTMPRGDLKYHGNNDLEARQPRSKRPFLRTSPRSSPPTTDILLRRLDSASSGPNDSSALYCVHAESQPYAICSQTPIHCSPFQHQHSRGYRHQPRKRT